MSTKDGRIPLNVDVLKTLRQRRGLSQDKLAELCFDQGYVVSISSIKRAESGMNVLYRTAKNLAGFYGIPVERLLLEAAERETLDAIDADIPGDPTQGLALLQLTIGFAVRPADDWLMTRVEGHHGRSLWFDDCLQISWHLADSDDHIFRDISRLCDGLLFDCPQPLRLALLATRTPLALPANSGPAFHSAVNNVPAGARLESGRQAGGSTSAAADLIFNTAPLAALGQMPWGSMIACPVFVSSGWFRRCASMPVLTDAEASWYEVVQVPGDTDRFVGRQRELQRLQRVILQLHEHQQGAALCLYGMAGIGKTRLLVESLNYAERLSCRVSSLQLLNRGMADRLSPLNRLVRTLCEFDSQDDDGFIRQQISMSTLPSQCHLIICWLMGLPLGDIEKRLLAIMDFAAIQAATTDAIRHIMVLRQGFQPRVVCLEDMHWVDETLMAVVRAMLDHLEGANLLLLMTFRQQNQLVERQDWFDDVDLIELLPLTDAESIELAQQLHPDDVARQQQCLQMAKGHPLYLRQTLLCAQLDNHIPESLEQLVLAQLSQLAADDLGAIKAASVFGQCFALDQLRFVIDNPGYLPDRLQALGLIKKAGRQYMFHHDLICTAVYRQLSAAQQGSLNRRCADWYKERNPFLYAMHYRQAGAEDAYQVLIDTAAYYIDNFHPDQALRLIDEAMTCADPARQALVLNLKGTCLFSMGRVQDSLPLLESALEQVGDGERYSRYALDLVNSCRMTDQIHRAMTLLDQAQSAAEIHQQDDLLADIHFMRGNMLFPQGDMAGCEREHQRSLYYSSRTGSVEARAKALGGLGDCAYAQARMTTAHDYLQECLQLCSDHQLIRVEASNRYMLGTVLIYQLKFAEALQQLQLAANLAKLTNNRRAEIVSRLTAGWVLLDLQAHAQAELEIGQAMAIAESLQANRFIAFLLESQARLQWQQGQPALARASIQRGMAMVTGQGMDRFIGPWLCSTQALVCGDDQTAAELALQQGENWLASPCVGHNYLRFYQQGIQVAWRLQDYVRLRRYRNGLFEFTRIEPNPWADFYIRRADLMLGLLEHSVRGNELMAFNSEAEQLGLRDLVLDLAVLAS
mgnify:CR=1 FL=1